MHTIQTRDSSYIQATWDAANKVLSEGDERAPLMQELAKKVAILAQLMTPTTKNPMMLNFIASEFCPSIRRDVSVIEKQISSSKVEAQKRDFADRVRDFFENFQKTHITPSSDLIDQMVHTLWMVANVQEANVHKILDSVDMFRTQKDAFETLFYETLKAIEEYRLLQKRQTIIKSLLKSEEKISYDRENQLLDELLAINDKEQDYIMRIEKAEERERELEKTIMKLILSINSQIKTIQ